MIAFLVVAAAFTAGVAAGLRFRFDENRRLSDENGYSEFHAVDIRRLQDHADHLRGLCDRLWNVVYAERANRLGWPERLP